MSGEDQQGRSWIQRLVDGDDEVAREFWALYGHRLRGLAEKLLNSRFYRREGPEDVVQSVCRTFVRRAGQGEFELANRDALWRLLCAITVNKTREKARFHGQKKRASSREQGGFDGRLEVTLAEPTPAEAVAFADHMQHLLASLDEEDRRVVELRLQEYTYPEIAERMQSSKRTVRRILKRIQVQWQRLLRES